MERDVISRKLNKYPGGNVLFAAFAPRLLALLFDRAHHCRVPVDGEECLQVGGASFTLAF